jgi:predicted RNase H-like HicB family nuclease
MKIVIEKHPDGYVAYPLGLKGVVVGQGDTYDQALADVKSAIRFHIDTFGNRRSSKRLSPRRRLPDAQIPRRCSPSPGVTCLGAFGVSARSPARAHRHVASQRGRNLNAPDTSESFDDEIINLRTICTQSGIPRDAFLKAYEQA